MSSETSTDGFRMSVKIAVHDSRDGSVLGHIRQYGQMGFALVPKIICFANFFTADELRAVADQIDHLNGVSK